AVIPRPCYSPHAPRALPSFPTRRSSDLVRSLEQRHDAARLREQPLDHGLRDLLEALSLRNRLALGEPQPASLVHREAVQLRVARDRKSTRLNSSHVSTSYAVFCLKKKQEVRHRPLQEDVLYPASYLSDRERGRDQKLWQRLCHLLHGKRLMLQLHRLVRWAPLGSC